MVEYNSEEARLVSEPLFKSFSVFSLVYIVPIPHQSTILFSRSWQVSCLVYSQKITLIEKQRKLEFNIFIFRLTHLDTALRQN